MRTEQGEGIGWNCQDLVDPLVDGQRKLLREDVRQSHDVAPS